MLPGLVYADSAEGRGRRPGNAPRRYLDHRHPSSEGFGGLESSETFVPRRLRSFRDIVRGFRLLSLGLFGAARRVGQPGRFRQKLT